MLYEEEMKEKKMKETISLRYYYFTFRVARNNPLSSQDAYKSSWKDRFFRRKIDERKKIVDVCVNFNWTSYKKKEKHATTMELHTKKWWLAWRKYSAAEPSNNFRLWYCIIQQKIFFLAHFFCWLLIIRSDPITWWSNTKIQSNLLCITNTFKFFFLRIKMQTATEKRERPCVWVLLVVYFFSFSSSNSIWMRRARNGRTHTPYAQCKNLIIVVIIFMFKLHELNKVWMCDNRFSTEDRDMYLDARLLYGIDGAQIGAQHEDRRQPKKKKKIIYHFFWAETGAWEIIVSAMRCCRPMAGRWYEVPVYCNAVQVCRAYDFFFLQRQIIHYNCVVCSFFRQFATRWQVKESRSFAALGFGIENEIFVFLRGALDVKMRETERFLNEAAIVDDERSSSDSYISGLWMTIFGG